MANLATISNNILADSGIDDINVVVGTGTTNYLPKFTGSTTIGNSSIQDGGSSVTYTFSTNPVFNVTDGTNTTRLGVATTAGAYVNIAKANDGFIRVKNGLAIGTSDGYYGTYFDVNGNLGLGVTPSAWVDYKGFQIGNQGSIGATSTVINLSQNVYYGASGNSYIENGKAAMYQMNDGVHGWRIAGTGTAGNAISFTQAMTLKATSQLQLNQYGSGTFTGTRAYDLAIDASGNIIEVAVGAGTVTGTGTTNYLPKWTSASAIGDSQIVDNGTNVGIGTNTPRARLYVYGGDIAAYKNTGINPGAQLYLGDLNFENAGYWNSAPGLGAVYSTNGTSVAGDLAFYIYGSLSNSRSEVMRMVRVGSDNRVAIGTSTAYANLQVLGTIKVATGNAQGILGLGEGNGTTVNVGIWRGAANAPTTDGNYLNLGGYDGIVFATGADVIGSQSQRMRLTADGTLLINQTSTLGNPVGAIEVTGLGNSDPTTQTAVSLFANHGNNANWVGYFSFYKSRGTTQGSVTAVADGDYLGMVRWNGADGTSQVRAAEIFAVVDGAVGTGDMPTRLVFATTPDGTSSPTEKMRITNGGSILILKNKNIGINTADGSDDGYLEIAGASSGGSARAAHIYLSGNERTVDGGNLVLAAGDNTAGTGLPGAIVFRTGASNNRAMITNDGQFNINNTTNTTYRLYVAGTSYFTDAMVVNSTFASGKATINSVYVGGTGSGAWSSYLDSVVGQNNLHIGTTSASGALYINYAVAAPTYMQAQGGNVGIGLAAADNLLHIERSIAGTGLGDGILFKMKNASTTADTRSAISFGNISGVGSALAMQSAILKNGTTGEYDMTWDLYGGAAGWQEGILYLDSNPGRIGIGTQSPGINSFRVQLSLGSGPSSSPSFALYNTATSPTASASNVIAMGFGSGTSNYVLTNTVLGALVCYGQANDADYGATSIQSLVTTGGNVGRSSHVVDMLFNTKPSGNTGLTEKMRLTGAGNLGLGDTNPTSSKLSLIFDARTISGISMRSTVDLRPPYYMLDIQTNTVRLASNSVTGAFLSFTETTALANGRASGMIVEMDGSASVNINGGLVGIIGRVGTRTAHTTGYTYGVYGLAGSSSTHAFGVVAGIGSDVNYGGKAGLLAYCSDTSTAIALFYNGNGEVARFAGDGNLGINTSSPSSRIHAVSSTAISSQVLLRLDGGAAGFNGLNDANTGFSIMFDGCSYTGSTGVVQRNGAEIQMLKSGSWNEDAGGSGTKASLVFKTNNGTITSPDLGERMRISPSGNILINQNSALTGVSTSVEMSGVGSSTSTLQASYNVYANHGAANTTWRGYYVFHRSRGTTAGSVTSVADGDYLGTLRWNGADGTGEIIAAEINAIVDGTVGTNDMPARLVFSTTADGASSPTERMIIRNNGVITVNTTSTVVNNRMWVNLGQTESFRAGTWETYSYTVNNAWLGENVYFDGNFKRRAAGYAIALYSDASAGFQIRMAGTSSAGSTISWTNALAINSSYAATFSSSVTATGFFESSDRRIKDLVDQNYKVDGIEIVKPKLYKKNGVLEYGYYAQDFQEILPSAVYVGDNGFLNLSYTQIHSAKIAYLEDSIEEIKAKIIYLENQLKNK
jgi:hypothetical protein